MRLSRRGFLAATAIAGVPLVPLRASMAAAPAPLTMGELWGMPYLAPGALGNLPAARRNAGDIAR